MANPWFKFYGPEYLSDTKFLGMDGNTRSCWLTLLCYAANGCGTVEYLTEDQLMIQAGVPLAGDEWTKTVGVLGRFQERNMLTVKDGVIHITNWQKRQESNLSESERSKNYRERHKPRDDRHANVTLDKNREEEIRVEGVASAPVPIFERKIREKDAEYSRLVKDLAARDYLSAPKIHQIALSEFLPHWLERSEGAKKARFEKEKSFDYLLRFRTWVANHHKWQKDYRCKSDVWHRQGESCYCVKEIQEVRPSTLTAEQKTVIDAGIRALAAVKTP